MASIFYILKQGKLYSSVCMFIAQEHSDMAGFVVSKALAYENELRQQMYTVDYGLKHLYRASFEERCATSSCLASLRAAAVSILAPVPSTFTPLPTNAD